MRITILSFFQDEIQRGVEIYAKTLLTHLKQVSIVSSSCSPYTGLEPLLLKRFYLDKTSLEIKKATQIALKKLSSNPPDILYPLNNGWQSLLCKRFCLNHQTKLVLGGHSGPGWDDRINLLLKPDAFIVFSDSQKKWAQTHKRPKQQITTIPHGVNTHQFAQAKIADNLKLPRPIFVTVSALSPQRRGGETHKNIDSTIKAIAKLKQGSLLLIGDGPDKPRIDKLAKNLLGKSHYQNISVSHNIIQNYYHASDVFTLASSASEAFGIVYLEALASGLPVVTLNDSLRRQIVGPAGVYINNPQDSNEYSRGLKIALETNWGNKPQVQAQKYSWAKIIPQYQKLFKNLLK